MRKFDEKAVFSVFAVLLFCGVIVSLCVGKYPLSFTDIAGLLTGKIQNSMKSRVFFFLRLPRTVVALIAGAGLGLAGWVYQTVFRNPLASPDITGISSGANLGAAVVIVVAGNSAITVASGAFAGGLAAVLAVAFLVRSTKSNTTSTFILSGIIIASVSKAAIMLLKYYADSDSGLAAIEYWTMGSLASVTMSKLSGILPFWIVGFAGLLLLHRQIVLLSLSDEEAESLGVNVRLSRFSVLSFSTLLVSSVISITGLISFSGLIAPHIARLITGKRDFRTMILSALTGAFVIVVSDIAARSIGSSEIPISIVTTFFGVPFLVFFMLKRRRNIT
ncbi:MAG: iron ABC transporter permease [Sphaerochaetaceae bacterium]|nr:iron ABC transporter permease [Sphaerochaetaceae bacterium]